jgi:antitoxin VapB
MKLSKAKTKTEAVHRALQAQLAEARRALPLRERLARSKTMADAIGPSDPAFDMKAFTDEGWGEA